MRDELVNVVLHLPAGLIQRHQIIPDILKSELSAEQVRVAGKLLDQSPQRDRSGIAIHKSAYARGGGVCVCIIHHIEECAAHCQQAAVLLDYFSLNLPVNILVRCKGKNLTA
jgi:hypothetical protein